MLPAALGDPTQRPEHKFGVGTSRQKQEVHPLSPGRLKRRMSGSLKVPAPPNFDCDLLDFKRRVRVAKQVRDFSRFTSPRNTLAGNYKFVIIGIRFSQLIRFNLNTP